MLRHTIEYKGVDYWIDEQAMQLRAARTDDAPIDLTSQPAQVLDEIADLIDIRMKELDEICTTLYELSSVQNEPLLHEKKNHSQGAKW